MYSGAKNDSLLLFHLLLTVCEGSNRQHITGVASICLTEHFSSKSIFGLGVVLKLAQISLQISVGIWIAVSKIHSVVVMVELDAKRQSVVVPCLLLLYRVLIIADVFTHSMPALAI